MAIVRVCKRGLGLAAVASVAALALVPGGAAAQTPTAPDLSGEIFLAQTGQFAQGTVTVTSRECNVDGESTISFTATGPSTAPYPGTFTEQGTFSIAAPSYPTSTVARLDTTFTIDSPVGQVSGTKRLDTSLPADVGIAICNNNPAPFTQQFVGQTDQVRYDATIERPGGSVCTDSGSADFTFSDNFTPSADGGRVDRLFQEIFRSDGQLPECAPPPQCSDGQDNDADGRVDHPADAGCESQTDDSEAGEAQCQDGQDNDADGRVDHPADAGCESQTDDSEAGEAQCQDGQDNDNDKKVDYPDDQGCDSPTDQSEKNNDKVKKDKP